MNPAARPRLQTPALLLCALAWLGATAWARPLMLPDEGRYVGVAWEMLRSGDWLTPTLDGLPYFHKPPLFYWITAASLALFGPHEGAARAAPLLGAWAAAVAVYLFVRRWRDERTARLALVALLAQPLFYLGGQFANLDMLVAGCITVTIVLLAWATLALERGAPFRRVLAVAWAAAALGVLAKGLIGFVLPALVIGAWLLLRRRPRTLARLAWWPAVALFAVIAAPWFAAMQQRHPGFLDYFFVVQHFSRYAGGGFNNVQPFWFLPVALAVLSLPWLPFLRPQFAPDAAGDAQRAALRGLALTWMAAVLLFFSIPQSKLVGYILPAVPPLAILLADSLHRRGPATRAAVRRWWIVAGLTSAVGIGTVAALSVSPRQSTRELGTVLRQQRGPHEPVYMLGAYYFDLPLYARLPAPVAVVLDWTAVRAARRDSWREELADAAGFAPDRGPDLLLQPQQLAGALCSAPVSWLIGPAGDDRPAAAASRAVATVRGTTLWRLDSADPAVTAALHCAGTPNDDSAGR